MENPVTGTRDWWYWYPDDWSSDSATLMVGGTYGSPERWLEPEPYREFQEGVDRSLADLARQTPMSYEDWVGSIPACDEPCLKKGYQEYLRLYQENLARARRSIAFWVSMTHPAPQPPDPMTHPVTFRAPSGKICKRVNSGTVKGVDSLKVLAAYAYPRPGATASVAGPDLHATKQPTSTVKVAYRQEVGWQWPAGIVVELEGPAVFAANGQKRIEVSGPEASVQIASSRGTGEVTVKAVPKGFDLPPGTARLNAIGYQIPHSAVYPDPEGGSSAVIGAWLMDPDFQPVAGATLRFATGKGEIVGSREAVTDENGYAEVAYQLPADLPPEGQVETVGTVSWVQYPDVTGKVVIMVGEPSPDGLVTTTGTTSYTKPAPPPAVPPASHIRPAGCAGEAAPTPEEPRIVMKAEPGKLDEKNSYTAKVTAQIKALPGRPASAGLPITLDVVAPGELKDVKALADGATATLTTQDKQDFEVMVRATSADGAVAFLIVPVGRLALLGQVVRRPGEGQDIPVVGASATATAAGGTTYQNTTDSRGEYKMVLKSGEPLTVKVTAPGYLDAALKGATPAPDAAGWVKPEPIYLVPRDVLELARRRQGTVQGLHKDMFFGSGSLLGLLGPSSGVADPTAPGASLDIWLNRVESEPARPAHTEEALRRMNLALEVAQLAGQDAKAYADEVAAAIWDDGLGAVMDLLSAVTGLSEFSAKQATVASPSQQQIMDQMLKTNLMPTRQSLEERLTDLLYSALGGKLGADFTREQAEGLLQSWTEKSIEDSRKRLAEHWKPEPGAQEAALDIVTGKASDVLAREAKGAISSLILKRYLQMLSSEMDSAVKRAVTGPGGGFTAEQYLEAHRKVRANIGLLRTTRDLVGNTPGDEALKTFVDGAIKSYKGWGKLAIAAVTSGQALPVLEKVDVALDFGSAALKAARFQKGMTLLQETLTPGSIWWQAVQRGIRASFDDARLPEGAAPAAVTFFVGQARLSTPQGERSLEAAPFITQGRTLLPLRAAAEALGATVGWDGATRQITITRGARTLQMTLGSSTAVVNGAARPIDADPTVVPVVVEGRTFVPFRFLAEALGGAIKWDPDTRAITLTLE